MRIERSKKSFKKGLTEKEMFKYSQDVANLIQKLVLLFYRSILLAIFLCLQSPIFNNSYTLTLQILYQLREWSAPESEIARTFTKHHMHEIKPTFCTHSMQMKCTMNITSIYPHNRSCI